MKCPTCNKESVQEHRPFCSERCRMQDLGNWASEKYVVSDPIFDEEEIEKADGDRKTIILDLNETDDSER